MKAMYTAATGMDGQTIRINTIANNLANANTTGFKKSQVDFADLMYMVMQRPGGAATAETQMPTGLEIGSGVTPVSALRIFTQGGAANTAGELDLMVAGPGFFQVQAPDGTTRYTRDGNFRRGPEGGVVTSQGYPLTQNLTVPNQATGVSVGSDGTVSAIIPGAEPQVIGQIQLALFPNPAGLSAEGGNLFSETGASGTPTVGIPGQNGLGEIKQGYLEMSNVDVVTELVDLIIAQRTYELNSKVVKAGDRILQATNYVAG